jgi:hypothetical protein
MNDPRRPTEKLLQVGTVPRRVALCERLLAIGLALLLLRSAFAHLGNLYLYLSAVYAYQLTGITVGKWVAIVLPFLQLAIAFCLIAEMWAREAYALSLAMFGVFLIAQATAIWRGLDISCGCFGTAHHLQIGVTSISVTILGAVSCGLGLALRLRFARDKDTTTSEGRMP